MVGFFLLAFGISWSLQALIVFELLPAPLEVPVLAVATCGPSLAALLVDRGAALSSLRRVARPTWLLVAALVPLAIRLLVRSLGPSDVAEARLVGALLWIVVAVAAARDLSRAPIEGT